MALHYTQAERRELYALVLKEYGQIKNTPVRKDFLDVCKSVSKKLPGRSTNAVKMMCRRVFEGDDKKLSFNIMLECAVDAYDVGLIDDKIMSKVLYRYSHKI